MPDLKLGDKALSVLTFAAYHQPISGNLLREAVLKDGSCDRADRDGEKEVVSAGSLQPHNHRGRQIEAGDAALGKLLEHIRATERPRVAYG
jgi:hypothetical protein